MMRIFLTVSVFSLFGMTASAQYASDWNPDSDGDNTIGVNDLLALLSVFEETDSDNDGIFDSQDDCVGAYDACGVCNGPGPTVVVGDSLVCPIYGCTDNLASNFSASANTDDGTCAYGPAQCGGASTVTFDGHAYNLVGIGNQCWFKENLRSDNYRNGDVIPGNLSDGQWTSTTSGAQTVYGEGSSAVYSGSSDETANLATYGRLYNWYAVNDERGLCPTGFHVPTDGEWMTLEMALGMNDAQVNATGWRGTDQGLQMKSSSTDSPTWNGTNSSGFSALPGGSRIPSSGVFHGGGIQGDWWSNSADGSCCAWFRSLNSNYDNFRRDGGHSQRWGFSVRCVRDGGVVCLDPDSDGVCAENEVSGCTDSNATNFNPSATEDDGSCVISGPAQCGGQSTVTFDGHTYNLVGIGTQCWFKENLRSDNYRNGDEILGNFNDGEWASTGSGAQAVYNNDSANLLTYGRLYNWYAIDDARGICPLGFHVPSDGEWTELENVLGGAAVAGTKLKSSPVDSPLWDGTNSTGWSAIPGGYRHGNGGYFYTLGINGGWWSSSLSQSQGWFREMYTGYDDLFRYDFFLRQGFSVRCIKD
jgi:uncharacterized protein (TIGR02145 family)